jgi:hypothetical protein
MRIDRTHRPWMMAFAFLLGAAIVSYVLYARLSLTGPRGGSAVGLAFGIVGDGLMIYAGLLGVRKKKPVWRVGRAQTWMRGHLWLGLLSFPLIVFHSGFAARGPLTRVLMVLFLIVSVAGIVGAVMQHFLPRMILTQVPLETIYEQIPVVRRRLRDEADALVATVEPLRETYQERVRPFLEAPDKPGADLGVATRAADLFQSLRTATPTNLRPVIDDLENICEEQRQLILQRRLYHWLHVWQLVHVPLSIVLLILGGIHAVVALLY